MREKSDETAPDGGGLAEALTQAVLQELAWPGSEEAHRALRGAAIRALGSEDALQAALTQLRQG